VYPDYHYPPRG
jgi:ribosomal protein L4